MKYKRIIPRYKSSSVILLSSNPLAVAKGSLLKKLTIQSIKVIVFWSIVPSINCRVGIQKKENRNMPSNSIIKENAISAIFVRIK